MIEPTEQDIGRKVVYTGNRFPGGKLEDGVITSFNSHCVFVRYGNDANGKATSREDLSWLGHTPPPDPPKCPACGSSDYNQHHHHGDFHAPECWWWECDECGHKTEPE